MGLANKYSVAEDIAAVKDALQALDDAPTTLPPHGTKAVTTAGTRVALVASSTPLPRGGCYVIPWPTNTGVIYIGGASVSSTLCVRAGAGMMVPVAIDDAEEIWIDATVSGEGVSYVGF